MRKLRGAALVPFSLPPPRVPDPPQVYARDRQTSLKRMGRFVITRFLSTVDPPTFVTRKRASPCTSSSSLTTAPKFFSFLSPPTNVSGSLTVRCSFLWQFDFCRPHSTLLSGSSSSVWASVFFTAYPLCRSPGKGSTSVFPQPPFAGSIPREPPETCVAFARSSWSATHPFPSAK